jgi:hypothetical protein
MFRITEDTSSGSLVQCLATKNYKNGSIVSVDMDKALWQHIVTGCMCMCVCVCVVHWI